MNKKTKIIEDLKEGLKQIDIADKYEVTKQYVSKIKKLYLSDEEHDFLELHKKKIQELKKLDVNEANTKSNLIDPILKFLGWDIHNFSEVEKEKEVISGRFVDYALKIDGVPKIYIEVKKVNFDLSDIKTISKAIGYAFDDGISWLLITNGDNFNLYKTEESGDLNNKIIFEIKISNNYNVDFLRYLKKENFEDNFLISELNRITLTNKIIYLLNVIFTTLPDDFINYFQLKSPELTSEQIKEALRNINFEFENINLPKEVILPDKNGFKTKFISEESKDILEIKLPRAKTAELPTWKKYSLIPFPVSHRKFFPGYKIPFTIKTDIGEIISWVTGGYATDKVGDLNAGSYISKGIAKFYKSHPELKPGDFIKISKFEQGLYKLEII